MRAVQPQRQGSQDALAGCDKKSEFLGKSLLSRFRGYVGVAFDCVPAPRIPFANEIVCRPELLRRFGDGNMQGSVGIARTCSSPASCVVYTGFCLGRRALAPRQQGIESTIHARVEDDWNSIQQGIAKIGRIHATSSLVAAQIPIAYDKLDTTKCAARIVSYRRDATIRTILHKIKRLIL